MAQSERLALLCDRIRSSDRQAYAEVFHALRPALLRYVDALVRDPAGAHDIVQDVFVALWEQRHTLDPTLPLPALLYRMARYRSMNHLRARRVRERHAATVESAYAPEPADPDVANLSTRLAAWIDALPDRQREALQLTRYSGLTHREAADVMEISPRTVNNHLVRALATLQERLAALETVAR